MFAITASNLFRMSLLLLLAHAAQAAQAQSVFQPPAAVKHPPLWVDPAYVPPVQDGAMHLRVGRAGVSGFSGIGRDQRLVGTAIGEPTCDLNYLYHAKAGTFPDAEEVSACARLEERIRQMRGFPARDMNDSFTRSDVEKEWKQWMSERIQAMKTFKRFYFRPSNLQLMPYDMGRHAFDVNVFIDSPLNFIYTPHLILGHSMDVNGRVFETRINPDASLARDLEWARSKDKLDLGMALVQFDLDRVGTVSRTGEGLRRAYYISRLSWTLPFYRQSGSRAEITITE